MPQESQNTDLTSPEAVAASQQIYNGMVSGQVADVTAALHAAHGTSDEK